MPSTDRSLGRALVTCSALTFSSAGVFTQGVAAGSWEIVFWRGLAATVFTLAYLVLARRIHAECRAFGWSGLAAAVAGASGTAAFIAAFKLTDVASVTLIYGTCPFVAAGLGWLWLAEPPAGRDLLASLAALAGVGLTVSGAIGPGGLHGSLLGDLLAGWMTLMMACLMLIYRRWPATPAALPPALSSVLLLPIAATLGQPATVPPGQLAILLAFGLVFAVASVTLSLGARKLSGVETALLSTLELPFAPLLAFVILAEVPSGRTLLGGLIVLAAVLWSQLRPRAATQAEEKQA
jgi:drug/metabolite transporter (DMT)-like permease